MQDDVILNKVRRLIADTPGCLLEFDRILPEHRLYQDLGIDSLSVVDLMVTLEDTFNVYFDPVKTDLSTVFDTVISLVAFIENERCSPGR